VKYEDAIKVMQEARVRSPALVLYGGNCHAFSQTQLLGSGKTYAGALRAAKLLPRQPPREAVLYVNIDCTVLRGTENICVARTRNTAHRIANALNAYVPNEDGY
jgi:hypothetical protein